MNMLESLLQTCELECYLPNFKKYEIDAFTLKLLRDEDLKIIGIEDIDKRKLLLQRAANLQIPFEKFVDITIDKRYIQLVLAQAALQVPKLSAVLAIAINRTDVFVCDVRLTQAAECLRNCVCSLERQLEDFDRMVLADKKKKKLKYLAIPASIFATGIVLFIYSWKLSRYK